MVSVRELNRTIRKIEELQMSRINKFSSQKAKEGREKLANNHEYQSISDEIEELNKRKRELEEKHLVNRWDIEKKLKENFQEKLLQLKLEILAGDKPDDPRLQEIFNWKPEDEL